MDNSSVQSAQSPVSNEFSSLPPLPAEVNQVTSDNLQPQQIVQPVIESPIQTSQLVQPLQVIQPEVTGQLPPLPVESLPEANLVMQNSTTEVVGVDSNPVLTNESESNQDKSSNNLFRALVIILTIVLLALLSFIGYLIWQLANLPTS